MSVPSAAEVEHADWPTLQGMCRSLGLNPKGRSGVVRMRVLEHVRRRGRPESWRAGRDHMAALLTRLGVPDLAEDLWESAIRLDGLPSRISVSACRGRNRVPPGGASRGGPRGVRSDSARGGGRDRRGAESRSRAPPPRTNARGDRHLPAGAREGSGTRGGAQQSRRRLSADGRAEARSIESGPRRETRRLSADPTQPRESPEGAATTKSQEARGAKEVESVGSPFGNNQYGSRRGGINAGTVHGMGARLCGRPVAPHPESRARGRRLRGRPRPRKGTGIPPLGREP